ncbi:MAG: hypothetical protein M3305_10450 [Actinomycetota bacterium]|nr:hypothetical protein [Actinomycetota bacterium]
MHIITLKLLYVVPVLTPTTLLYNLIRDLVFAPAAVDYLLADPEVPGYLPRGSRVTILALSSGGEG